MPYIVRIGKVEDGEQVFEAGDIIRVKHGELSDVEEIGVVEWISESGAKRVHTLGGIEDTGDSESEAQTEPGDGDSEE